MLLGYHLIDKTKDEHLRELADAASSTDTLIFLDTNIIAYMFKLHTAARREFFAWADAIAAQGRLRIPAWCAGEYLVRVRDGQLNSFTPKSKDEDQPRKALDAMLDTASLFVDETLLSAIGFEGGRTAYLTQFREAIDGLKRFTRAFQHQFDPEAVHEEIQTHLGNHILESDLAALCKRAAEEGPARIEHRLPPGFRDDGKEENRLGDLIVWFELLAESTAQCDTFKHVLFLTNDQKKDWVYAPQRRKEIVRGMRRTVPNADPKLKIIDPRLAAEFARVVGPTNDVTIASLAALVEGLSKLQPNDFGQLAAAIQIDLSVSASDASPEASALAEGTPNPEQPSVQDDTQAPPAAVATAQGEAAAERDHLEVAIPDEQQAGSEDPATRPEADPQLPREVAAPVTQPAEQFLVFAEDGYRDGAYESDGPGQLNQIIEALRSHNWYVQNPAVEAIKGIRHDEFPSTAWFVLGRNIYQAACGNAQKAMDFIANLDIQLGRFPKEVGEYILAGMVFEIYFDSEGKLRTRGKAAYMDKPLSLLTRPQYERVRDFIRGKVAESRASWTYVPGDERPRRLELLWTPQQTEVESKDGAIGLLQSVRLDGEELLVPDNAVEADDWGLSRLRFTLDELVLELSWRSLIPRWAIERSVTPSAGLRQRFQAPEGHYLRSFVTARGEQ